MFSPEITYLVILEQHKDRLQKMERQQLLYPTGHQQSAKPKTHQKAISWLGTQMVAWGSKLQSYGVSSNITREIR